MPKATNSKPADKSAPAKKPTSTPAKKSADNGQKSLASLWDETDAAEGSQFPPEGEHVMRLTSAELSDKPGKGCAVIFKYDVIDGEHEGKSIASFYKMTDASGEKGPGIAYLKRDFELLGLDPAVSGKKLKGVLEKVSEDQPMCVVRVSENGNYTNAFLQGLATDDDGDGEGGGDEPTFEKGDEVEWIDDNGDTQSGTVLAVDTDENEATVKNAKGKKVTVALGELTKPEAKGDSGKSEGGETVTAEIAEGSEIQFKNPKDEDEILEGIVTEIDGDDITVKVGKKSYIIEQDAIVLDGEEGEGETVEIEVGDTVKFSDGDDDITGDVMKIKGDKAIVQDADGVKHSVALADLEKE